MFWNVLSQFGDEKKNTKLTVSDNLLLEIYSKIFIYGKNSRSRVGGGHGPMPPLLSTPLISY